MAERPGGVALHAEHLKLAFPNAKHITSRNTQHQHLHPQARTMAVGMNAEASGLIKPDDIVIADGTWAIALSNQKRVAVVVHGLYAGWFGESNPWARLQKEYFPGKNLIAVSEFVEWELNQYTNLVSHQIIDNAVDTSVFTPSPQKDLVVGIVASQGKMEKYKPIIEAVRREFPVVDIKGVWPNDISRGLHQVSVFLHLSEHEGNSYAILEAMACNLPVVGTNTGLLWERDHQFGGIIHDVTAESVLGHIRHVYNNRESYRNREYVEEHHSLPRFIGSWRNAVSRIKLCA